MGLKVNKNEEGFYQLIETMSGEQLHDKEWITQDKAKKVLIIRNFWYFVEKIIEIDLDFPEGYSVNGKIQFGDQEGSNMIIKMHKNPKMFGEKYLELKEKYKLNL